MVRDVVLDGDQEGREDDRHVQQPADQDAEGASHSSHSLSCGTHEWTLSFEFTLSFAQLENAKRIASGDLFPTSWVEFDQRAKELEERTNRQ